MIFRLSLIITLFLSLPLPLSFKSFIVKFLLLSIFFLSFSLWDRLALERKKICTDFFACSSSRSWWYLIQSSVIPLLFYFVWWTNSSASVLIFSLNFTFSDSSELHQSTKGGKKTPRLENPSFLCSSSSILLSSWFDLIFTSGFFEFMKKSFWFEES